MRTFKQFMSRRKIKDARAWVKSMGFKSDQDVRDWCALQDTRPPAESFFDAPAEEVEPELSNDPPPPEPEQVKPAVQKSTTKQQDSTWVPAAERSRKVKGRKPAVKKQKEGAEEDEASVKTTKKSNTKYNKR